MTPVSMFSVAIFPVEFANMHSLSLTKAGEFCSGRLELKKKTSFTENCCGSIASTTEIC